MTEVTQFANMDAEKSVLGSILLDEQGAQYDVAVGLGLTPDDFSASSHREIFRVVVSLLDAGANAGLVALVNSLSDLKRLDAVGGAGYISSLIDGSAGESVKGSVKIILEKSAKRRTAAACESAKAGLEAGDPSKRVISALEESLLSIQVGNRGGAIPPVAAYSNEVINEWVALAESDRDILGISTGLHGLDTSTCGICPGELWLYGGRTGDGKSSLALGAAAANCRAGLPVGVFSYELSRKEILHRLWVAESNSAYQGIRRPRSLSQEKRKEIVSTACEVGMWPLYIEDDSGLNISQLAAKARLLVRQHGIKLLIVDYVQLVGATASNERERITKISNALRILAKDSQVPVIAISQLSRPRDGDENVRPNKFSLKESGSLENDAHTIVLVYRPKDRDGSYSGNDELIIAKQRNGMTGSEAVVFSPRTLTFQPRETGRGASA